MEEIKDKQRKAFENLIANNIPNLMREKSFLFENRYEVTYALYPIDIANAVDDKKTGSIYVTIKTVCTVRDLETDETQNFIIDVLKLPVYGELGFKIGGNYRQVLGLYERPAGWAFLRKVSLNSVPIISATVQSERGSKWTFKNTNSNVPIIERNRGREEGSDDFNKLSVSTFFRALTGYSNEELLEIFGYDNPVNLLAFNGSENTLIELEGKKNADNAVANRNDCIKLLAIIMFGRKKVESGSNTIASLQSQIENSIFSRNYFNLGRGNSAQLNYKQSFKNRATNKILAESVVLKDEVVPEGTILSAEILTKIDNSPVDSIKVNYNGKVHTLHKFSFFTFRALGYYLAEKIDIDGITMEKGHKLTLHDLTKLNSTELETIKVADDENMKDKKEFSRRLGKETLSIEDLFTSYSIFANNLNGFDTFDKEYELTNRIVVPFDKKAIDFIENHIDKITNKIKDGIHNAEISVETDGERLPLLSISSALKFNYNLDELLNNIAAVDDNSESQMSDINNVMSFLSKSYKITANLSDSNVTDDLVRIQDTQIGRLDLYDAPESKKIGRVHHKTLLAEEDSSGYITTPFFRVENGVVTDDVVYLTAAEEENAYVAEWCETFKNEDGTQKSRVLARYNGEVVNVDVNSVTLREYSFLQNIGPTTSCIPFINHSNGKRITMSDNQQKQAVPILKNRRPLVNTGAESFLGIGKYTARDIIKIYYDSVILKFPILAQYQKEIFDSSIQIHSISNAPNGDRIFYFDIEAIDKIKDNDESLEMLTLAKLQVPYNYRTTDSGLFTYKVNTKKSIYSGNDIVLYSSDYDITKYDLDCVTNFGGQVFEPDIFDNGTALGRDYLIAYKTYGGSTIDDSLVINGRLISEDITTSVYIVRVEDSLFNNESKTEEFKSGPESPSYFETNGLPKIGTNLNPGDAVISKYVIQNNTSSKARSSKIKRFKYTRLNVNTMGQVVSTKIYNDKGRETACVILAVRAEISVGDKMAGRYGNKGVIGKIVPNELMPYDPISGRTIDIILDPEGIPSRMNISQLLEVTTGLACLKNGKHTVISQFNPEAEDYVRQLANSTDTHPIMLIDGRNGKYFERPINVGCMYMYKLTHMSRKKIHAIGMQSGVDNITLQPKRGGKANGGQKFGEMESWCLEGIGCMKVLQELQSTLSDDVITKGKVRKALEQGVCTINAVGDNRNDLMFQALIRSFCAEIVTNTDSDGEHFYEFKPLSTKEIKSLAPTPIKTEPALHSIESFGHVDSVEQKAVNKALWGYIDFPTEMISPIWLEQSSLHNLFLVRKTDKSSFDICGDSFFKELIRGKKYVRLTPNMCYLRVALPSDVEQMEPAAAEMYGTGFQALFYIFKHYNLKASYELLLDKIDKYEKSQIRHEDPHADNLTSKDYLKILHDGVSDYVEDEIIDAADYMTDTHMKNIRSARFVKDFIDRGSNLTDYLIEAYPVMSQVFRPQIQMPGINTKSDFDHYYVQILNAVNNIETGKSEKNLLALYEALAHFMGFRNSQKNDKYINLSNWFLGTGNEKKHGKIRESMQSKVILRSGRAVIVPAADTSMDARHIGIPISSAVIVWEEELISYLNTKRRDASVQIKRKQWKPVLFAIANRSFYMFRKAYKEIFVGAFQYSPSVAYSKLFQYMKLFFEGGDDGEDILEPQVVIAGRQPSLHQFSVRGFFVRIVEDKTIHVNPLVCKGFNADFDGDQMWYCAPISRDAKEEAITKMSAASNLINPKNGSIILELSQDIALGIYCSTMLKNNREFLTDEEKNNIPLNYNSLNMLKTDVYNRVISTYALVCLEYDNKFFISTAGRIIFNSILPNGLSGVTENGSKRVFTNPLGLNVQKCDRFTGLQYDGLITAGEGTSKNIVTLSLHDICKHVYEELVDENSLHINILSVFQELAEFGFEFSDIFGISISLDDLDFIKNSSNKQFYLDEMSAIQAKIEEDYQLGLFSDKDKHAAIQELSKKTMEKIQDDLFVRMDRDNNIFIMFDSGARGSKAQIAQTCGAIGMLDKTDAQTLETPIVSNYHEGMSSFDVQMMSYSARTGMSSTQNKTADAGYATRKSIYMTSGLKIVEWDCGKTDWWFDIMWDKIIPEYSVLKPTEEFFNKNLLGKKVWETNKETIDLFGDTLNNFIITLDSYKLLQSGFHSITIEGNIVEADLSNLKKYLGYKIVECLPATGAHYVDESFINESTKLEYLTVIKPEEILISPSSIIGYQIINDKEADREFKQFISGGMLNKKCAMLVPKKHILSINTNAGEFLFRYKMTDACRSLLEKREARDLEGLRLVTDREHRNDYTFIITDKTLDSIERNGIERIQARILLDCLSGSEESKHGSKQHGCCARCYGLKYTDDKFPKVGEIIGIESAQAVGEPAAQLTLSLVNKGGKAGESVASGIDIFERLLGGSVPQVKENETLVTNNSGYLSVEKLDDSSIIKVIPEDKNCLLCSKCIKKFTTCPNAKGENGLCVVNNKVLTTRLQYEDGTYIKAGEAITDGYVKPDSITHVDPDTLPELVRKKQMVWLLNYFNTFRENNIYINARHFEIFARLQNFMCLVMKSNDTNFEIGREYEYSEIVGHEEDVMVALNTSKLYDVVIQNSGALSALAFESVSSTLAKLVTAGHKSYRNSPIGALNVGENLVNGEKRVLNTPSIVYKNIRKDEDLTYGTGMFEFTVEESQNEDIELNLTDMDLDAIFNAGVEAISKQSISDHSVFCNIVDENDNAVSGTNISLSSIDENVNMYNSISDEFGAVTFNCIKPGEYKLSIKSDEYVLQESTHCNIVDSNINLGIIQVTVKENLSDIKLKEMNLFSDSLNVEESGKPEDTSNDSYNNTNYTDIASKEIEEPEEVDIDDDDDDYVGLEDDFDAFDMNTEYTETKASVEVVTEKPSVSDMVLF